MTIGVVTVVGAGLSGLATAWHLTARSAPVRVVEANVRPGGLIQTLHTPEGLIETGARAFRWTGDTDAFFRALAVPPLFAREPSTRRYIFRDGRPRRWPLSAVETAGAAARFGRAWLSRGLRPDRTETVAAWGERVMGASATTWLIAPALQGIYASPPCELSAAALFGKRRPRGRLAAPAGGMGELITRLHAALQQRGVTFEFDRTLDAGEIDRAHPAVICTNAPAAARLLAPHAPALAAALGRIRMVSIVVVTAFFAPRADDPRGFGVLFPRSSGVRARGVLFDNESFAGRSDLRSESWIYGDLDPAVLPGDGAEAREAVVRDRAALTGRSDLPLASYVARRPRALPVYDAAVLEAQAALPDLPAHVAIAGNYLGRLGVSSLLTGAAEAAARLDTFQQRG
jgi:oxygen-dependent protoporphyrinogen oxidase